MVLREAKWRINFSCVEGVRNFQDPLFFFIVNRKNIKRCQATLILNLMVKEIFYDNLSRGWKLRSIVRGFDNVYTHQCYYLTFGFRVSHIREIHSVIAIISIPRIGGGDSDERSNGDYNIEILILFRNCVIVQFVLRIGSVYATIHVPLEINFCVDIDRGRSRIRGALRT